MKNSTFFRLVLAMLFFISISVVNGSNGNEKSKGKGTGDGDEIKGASTAQVTSLHRYAAVTFKKPFAPFNNMSVYAGTFNAVVDGNPTTLYCIDLQHNLVFNEDYTDTSATISPITYILNNYFPYQEYPYAGALNSENNEAAAVQASIWHFSDSLNVNTITNSAIRNRALDIILDADSNSTGVVPVQTLVFEPVDQSVISGNDVRFVVESYNQNNDPAANIEIILTTTAGTLSHDTIYTNASGISDTITLFQNGADSAIVTAAANVVIPQGTRYMHAGSPDAYQKLVLATPTVAPRVTNARINWWEQADLSITKIVDNSEPEDGDVISYTITVTNNGPSDASGIVVNEILPSGLLNYSYVPSQGSFDEPTTVWTVGNLSNGSSATLTITGTVDYLVFETTAFNLGPAADYNLFVLNDLDQPSSDTEGRVAVGRNATLSNYSVADKLPNSNGTDDVLVVGRKLTFSSGRVFSGNVVYGRFKDMTSRVSVDEGTIRQDTVVDFPASRTYLRGLSNQLKGYSTNGNTLYEYNGVFCTGQNPFLNVFSVNGDSLSASNNFEITVPNGAVVVVNINKNDISWSGGLEVHGTDISNVIYNFYQARNLEILRIDVTGSILAPKANVNFISGVQNGQMIAKNVTGTGQFNNVKFLGNVPIDTTIVNIAEIISSDQPDLDSTPNNGDNEEDDYADVSINISTASAQDVGNGNGGGGSFEGSWDYVGGFSSSEIIWTMTNDNSGNILTGTWGGNIYKSFDGGATWDTLSTTINATYIWDITVAANDDIYVATEIGIYRSVDDGENWTFIDLNGYDVRALTFVGNDLYAGTWGYGIYKSADEGGNWTETNAGLDELAVHAIVKNSNNELFAGTFGGGVYKSVDAGDSWTRMPVGYNHIWTLGISSDDVLYAGTYGGGVYVSETDGATWNVANNGLSGQYIYSITFDANDDVFLSSWSNGVYKLT
ncbi:MAG: choice-of-anchor A family protein, partial [Melioribacteraceae bacterium]|nr:choice-of-anchor A family protein [Melioribacteraceae bacterium]